MKKITLVFCALLFVGTIAKAQAPLQEGEMQINGGVGLSNYGLPLYGGLEYGIGYNISVGGEVSYRGYHETYSSTKWNHAIFTMAAIGNYHFNELLEIPSEWDFYAGLSLGYSAWSSKYDGNGSFSYAGSGGSGLYLVGQIGGRYFFNENVGLNVELGGGNYSGGKIGVTIKL
ncbi:hypothetical protein [Maribellus maritimus]|uniref:hypothetical protein n=1 Tax=Maribellus maritimus TaxID=2870838 RepID=UPI001EEC0077|nr:hypothetical protein [Maribellus maritimus]MCG6190150.1 hypothetical protein [Maribellus maritimus]